MTVDTARLLQYFAFSAPMAILIAILFVFSAVVILLTYLITRNHTLKFVHLHMPMIQQEVVISLKRELNSEKKEKEKVEKENKKLKGKVNRIQGANREAQMALVTANMESQDE